MQRGGPAGPARPGTCSERGHVSNHKVKASWFLEGRRLRGWEFVVGGFCLGGPGVAWRRIPARDVGLGKAVPVSLNLAFWKFFFF